MTDQTSNEELLKRITMLEEENKKLRSLKRKLPAEDPIVPLAEAKTHDFKLELKKEAASATSDVHTIDGLEFYVGVQRDKKALPGTDVRFCFLHVRNVADQRKFVIATTDVRSMMLAGSSRDITMNEPRGTPAIQQYVLSNQNEETGNWIKSEYEGRNVPAAWSITVSLSVIIQQLESIEPDEDSATIVEVGGKEFRVSSGLLASWSLYFRAYFRHDWKEKQQNFYPVKDVDISAEDFEELLSVIQPTPKAITRENYLLLLKMASRFEMPSLTLRIEQFMIQFETNGLERAEVFRTATDHYSLKIVQATLLHRWRDPYLLKKELMKTSEYEKLCGRTVILINERFAKACIASKNVNGGEWIDVVPDTSIEWPRNRSPQLRHDGYGFGGNRSPQLFV